MPDVDDEPKSFIVGPSPFDDPDADIIIRTFDNVEFATYKVLLSLASPGFKSAFRLPQPKNAEHSSNFPDAHVINVAEDSETMERILRFCYPCPIEDPILETLEVVVMMIEATRRFEMQEVQSRVLKQLISPRFVEREPLRVFAIACHSELEEEARVAAKHTLRFSVESLIGTSVPELNGISAPTYHKLLGYHQKCRPLAAAVASREAAEKWMKGMSVGVSCSNTNTKSSCRSHGTRAGDPGHWWTNYMTEVGVMLKERPCSATILDSDLFQKSVIGSNCVTCSNRALTEMERFKKLFASAVEKAIDEVSTSQ